MEIFIKVVQLFMSLSLLVAIHEFGHYIIAKICRVKVAEFSLGFGKQLWGKQDSSGTLWKISAIPLGGYCKFLGDTDAASSGNEASELSEEDKKYAFAFQNPFKKLAIVIGGPAFNYLFAIVVFTVILLSFGKMDFPPVIGSVIKGSAAEKAGILPQDKILTVDGRKVETFNEFHQEIQMNTSGTVALEILRGDKEIKLTIGSENAYIDGKAAVCSLYPYGFSPLSLWFLPYNPCGFPKIVWKLRILFVTRMVPYAK